MHASLLVVSFQDYTHVSGERPIAFLTAPIRLGYRWRRTPLML